MQLGLAVKFVCLFEDDKRRICLTCGDAMYVIMHVIISYDRPVNIAPILR